MRPKISAYPPVVDKYKMLLRLQVAAALGCFFIILYSLQALGGGLRGLVASLRIASVGILVAGGSLFLGFLLGFIFCIPRTKALKKVDRSSSIDGKESSSSFSGESPIETNTNLVDISDWLTKILVGVGLVELNKIPSGLRRLADFLSPGLRDCDSSACIGSSQSLAVGTVIFFFGAGFLIGYLWTRLYYQGALAELSKMLDQNNEIWMEATRAEVAWRAGHLDESMHDADRALRMDPSNAKALFEKARILKRVAQASGDKTLLQEAVAYASKAAALLPNDGGPLYNVACYQALLGTDKAEVIKNLKRAIELNPTLREEARQDPDFDSLRKDADFSALTENPPAPS